MSEGQPNYVLRGSSDPIYPGYRGGYGYVQNLSTYREEPVFRGSVIIDEALAFDIERHISWDPDYNLKPFSYSMMIDGYYPTGRFDNFPLLGKPSGPTIEEFRTTAAGLEGFVVNAGSSRRGLDFEEYKNTE